MISSSWSFATLVTLFQFVPLPLVFCEEPSTGRHGLVADLSFDVAAALSEHPVAAQVSVPLNPKEPTNRIIHLQDWHFVGEAMFRADLEDQYKRALPEREFQRLYHEHVQNVTQVQRDNKTLLQLLINRFGLTTVFVESLAPRDMPVFHAKVRSLGRLKAEVRQLRSDLDPLRDVGQSQDDLKQFVSKGRTFIARFERDLLRLGAAGSLYLSGELKAIKPPENAKAYDAAHPVRKNGGIRFDPQKNKRREEFIVNNLLSNTSVSLLVMGGNHDLAPHIRRQSDGRCQYIVVATKAYIRVSRENEAVKRIYSKPPMERKRTIKVVPK